MNAPAINCILAQMQFRVQIYFRAYNAEKSTTWEYLIIFESLSVGFIFELGRELRDTVPL